MDKMYKGIMNLSTSYVIYSFFPHAGITTYNHPMNLTRGELSKETLYVISELYNFNFILSDILVELYAVCRPRQCHLHAVTNFNVFYTFDIIYYYSLRCRITRDAWIALIGPIKQR